MHDFLGMKLDCTEDGMVKADMFEHIISMVTEFPMDLKKMQPVSSPDADCLQKVRDDIQKLSKTKAEIFHNMVARGLFVTKQARGNVHATASFLCARVQSPDANDWKKLCRLMRHLCQTVKLAPRLGVGCMSVINWQVDAAHTVHKACKGQTGAVVTLGKGTICNASTKQKLNARSSAESESVGSNDAMPQLSWTNYFFRSPRMVNTRHCCGSRQQKMHAIREEWQS